ncbi:MAG: glycosyltransferase family 4 protein [Candidatus Omnitrophica bacterium]|nr:glycosyltransferase family 4 protein [Candidatus Omnitrophota bacterium]
MRIGFDARMIGHPGIGRYITNLLQAMLPLCEKDEFLVFGDERKITNCQLPITNRQVIRYNTPVYSIKELICHPFSRHNLDVVHIPHFNAPLCNIKNLVVTIHDLIYTKFSEYLPVMKRKAAKVLIRNAVEKGDKIIAVSENTRNDILEINPKVGSKIRVIYEAADPIFKIIEDQEGLKAVQNKYNLPDNIILFVGSLKKHKNIERLLDAFSRVRSKGVKESLVIIGRYHPHEAGILNKIKRSDAIYLGEVPTEDLIAIYNLAKLFVLPSLYEGFGLPVLEAFASGLPVAASNTSSLPEVIQDAGVLFDPYDIEDICDGIYKALKDESFRHDLKERGLKRVKEFSWERTAKETLEVYKEIAGA